MPTIVRPSKRAPDALRPISFERAVSRHAEGSCLVRFGDTHVLCTATVERAGAAVLAARAAARAGSRPSTACCRAPRTSARGARPRAGKQSGRTQEIQRLIGRSLRAVTDLDRAGRAQVIVDCDVLQADGGTRTAAITGAWVALHDALAWMAARKHDQAKALRDHVAAVSCGLYGGEPVLDLDYAEDSEADADANFVMTGSGGIVEVQGTAEDRALQPRAVRRADGARAPRHRRARAIAEDHNCLSA